MIEPKDGEWWMCDRNGNGVKVPLYNYDGRWCESEFDREYNYSDANPLYKMVKAGGIDNLGSDYERGMREAMKDIAKSCGRKFGVDIGYLELPKFVDELINKDKPKPRTKVVHEKIEFNSVIDVIRYLDAGKWLYINEDSEDRIDRYSAGQWKVEDLEKKDFYRKVEKEVDWKDHYSDFIEKSLVNGDKASCYETLEILESEGLLRVIHEIAEMTYKPE